ncbi:MAG: hypothetical protein R2764_11430 [Bacteroidales bacterium]
MNASFAYGNIEHVFKKFLHPFKRDVLAGMKIADQTFYIIAIAYRSIGLEGEIPCCYMAATANLTIYPVFGYM